jgi:electron transport complex protein RnfG
MNKLVKDALILTVITFVSGLALGGVHEITKEPIKKTEEQAIQKAYKEVFNSAKSFDEDKSFNADKAAKVVKAAGYKGITIDDCIIAEDSSGKKLGYVLAVTNMNDYGGQLTFYMGITKDGKMNGYSITTINDTPGLGMKAKDDKFKSEFSGIEAGKYEVSKNGGGKGKIEAISGATITSRAVTEAVNAGFSYFDTLTGGAK